MFPKELAGAAKKVWQHTGEGISSRRAEYCKGVFKMRGFREQQRGVVPSPAPVQLHSALDLSAASAAKQELRQRIANLLSVDIRPGDPAVVEASDVYLYPSGMSALFNTHQVLLTALGREKESICFGFTYLDTLKFLSGFGPGCLFLGHSSLDLLETTLQQSGSYGDEKRPFLALFCEVPGNPLLQSPDMQRIKRLADRWGFVVVVDETVGTFVNVDVLPWADVVCTSLSKAFSGGANVMGGSAVINPRSRYYAILKQSFADTYEDNFFPTDALVLAHNSLAFTARIPRINSTSEALSDLIRAHPCVKEIYYPKHNLATLPFYEQCRRRDGGYGYLMTMVFHEDRDAIVFFDALEVAKGPSLGTDFTLASAYTLLAHTGELEWAAEYGVLEHMVRISVGLEDVEELVDLFSKALRAVVDSKASGEVGELQLRR
ncbi:MAG: hypothetical protein M1839_001387 [Geoglossum umbratile]|nr:MAG: hypothetical protein M1839_001387 [Geoglossum umbratile]